MILRTRLTVDLSQHLQFPTDRRCWQPLTLYVTADTQPGFSYAWIVTRHICFEISRRGCSYINQYWMEGSIYCTILYGRGSILLQRYKGGHCLFWDFQIPTTIESFKALPVFYYKYDMFFKGVLWASISSNMLHLFGCFEGSTTKSKLGFKNLRTNLCFNSCSTDPSLKCIWIFLDE